MIHEGEAMGVESEHVAQRPAVADDHVMQFVLRRDLGVRHLGPVDIAHRRCASVDDVIEIGVDVTDEVLLGHELHGVTPAMCPHERPGESCQPQ
jgi:hypothetical protein